MAAIALARQHARALELLQHAVQGGFGQTGLLDHGLQGEGRVLARNHLQQGKQAQVGGVAVQAGRRAMAGVLHHGLILINFFFRVNLFHKKRFVLTSQEGKT